MVDPRFFKNSGPFRLGDLVDAAGVKLADAGRENESFHNVAALDTAGRTDIACLHNPQFYIEHLSQTRAGAVIVAQKFVEQVPAGAIAIVTEQPYRAFAIIASLFYPRLAPAYNLKDATPQLNIQPSASVHPTATLGEGVEVSAGAVIGEHAVIGAHSWIGPHAVIDRCVVVGESAHIGAHVSLGYALVGDRVRIDAGARIGQPGFGFFMDHRNGHIPVPQLGRVCIGHDVAIGSNTTIDRGSMQDTIIEDGCMIDNLVQIAHNVHLGKRCVVVAQVGLSGSTHVGNAVTLAGQAGITGHLHIGDGAVVMAQSGVMRDVPAGATVAGSPAVPAHQWRRQVVMMNQQTKKV